MATKAVAGNAGNDKDTPQVEQQMKHLGSNLDHLFEKVAQLRNKLEPVLMDYGPSVESPEDIASMVPLARELSFDAKRVATLSDLIEDLLRNLEI